MNAPPKKPNIPPLIEKWLKAKGWENIEQRLKEKYGLKPDEKKEVSGAGCFTDESGEPRLSGRRIQKKWNRSWAGFFVMLVFTVFWNSIVVLFVGAMATGEQIKVNGIPYENIQQAFPEHPWMLVFLIFPLIGLVLAWSLLAILFNKSVYSVDFNQLSVKHGPIPLKKNLLIPRSHIQQLYVQKKIIRSNKSSRIKFRVMAKMLDGSSKVIDDDFTTYDNARILEQWLENAMGIQDKTVAGEVGA